MGYRYCPEGARWLETSEYTVDEHGETICPGHETAVHGFMVGPFPITEEQFLRDNDLLGRGEELDAAKRQGLVQ